MRKNDYIVWHSEVFVRSKGNLPLDPSATPASDAKGMGDPSVLHPFWLGLALPYMRKDDDLVLGYVKWDPIWHRAGWLHKAFNNLTGLAGLNGKLKLPLEWWEKKDVLENLRKWKFPIELCFSCRSPKGKRACGKCDQCIDRRDAERAIAQGKKKAPL
jgi:hypothetical protein